MKKKSCNFDVQEIEIKLQNQYKIREKQVVIVRNNY